MAQRKIIHIDMDAFYASIEQRDHPEYRGRPIVVGRDAERGVVATASYEARTYGVHSAMPSVVAKRRCPELIFVPARFEVYKTVSNQIREIFHRYTDLVEPLSIDEAFLDVSHQGSATKIAQQIKADIYRETGLSSSAGISVNKLLAKIASDFQKPNGLYVIPPNAIQDFVADLPIERFYGVGQVTAQRMHQIGIHTGADLRRWDEVDLVRLFGKTGSLYYGYARGIDTREVIPNRIRKSLGAETTFGNDREHILQLLEDLDSLCEEVWHRMQQNAFRGKTIVLKLKFDNFKQITRSYTLYEPVENLEVMRSVAQDLLRRVDLKGRKVRLLGVSIGNSEEAHQDWIQLKLNFEQTSEAK